ncbi:TPA: undecaprenyl diphosphate synthase family protein [Candidatus Woesearchaeota archaeon]|nr:undecaprenyl diphosphate synthase family protein [Candidatus Woesearchaeota archaeon]HIH39723.1 undecaprenyl diphosphate synthase family protein [Candidatus Woesearchaeota archaeon]
MKTKHIAVLCRGSAAWALKKKKKVYDGYRKAFSNISEMIELQLRKNIPIFTFYIMPVNVQEPDDYSVLVDELSSFLSVFSKNELLHENKIKISVLGKWYNMPSRLIDAIKNVIDATKDYDSYFVNFCIGYDGQEEIVDACKMIARRVKLGKFDAEAITKETIKDDLYSSYFLPPDTIFVTGEKCSLNGSLLWDSVNAEMIFLKKAFAEVKTKEIQKGIKN